MKSFFKTSMNGLVAITMINMSILAPMAQAQTATPEQQAGVQASLTVAQRNAMRLLIFTSVLSARTGDDIVKVRPEVRKKYDRLRNSVFASMPVTSVGLLTGYATKGSFEEFQSVVGAITAVVKFIGRGVIKGLHMSWDLLEKIGIDKILNASGTSSEKVWNFIQPVVKIFITKGALTMSAALSGSAILGASSFMLTHDAESALTHSTIRSILGEDKALQKQTDAVVVDLSAIFDLNASQQAIFKEALLEEVTKQGIANKFRSDVKYDINIVKILADRNLISREEAVAAELYKKMYDASTSHRADLNDLEKLKVQVDAITALSAILEEISLSGRLNAQSDKEVADLLMNTERNLKLIKANLN